MSANKNNNIFCEIKKNCKPFFLTNKQRVLNREKLTAMLSDAVKLFQKDELLKLCENKTKYVE